VRKLSYILLVGAAVAALARNFVVAVGSYLIGGVAFFISERRFPSRPTYVESFGWILMVWPLWPAMAVFKWQQIRRHIREVGRWTVISTGEFRNFHEWDDAQAFAKALAEKKSHLEGVYVVDYARPSVIAGQRYYFTRIVERDGSMRPVERESILDSLQVKSG